MLPDKLFLARSRICSELKFERLLGSYPENELDLKLRIRRFHKAAPIHAGILPENLLSLRSRISKFHKFWKDDGISPERW